MARVTSSKQGLLCIAAQTFSKSEGRVSRNYSMKKDGKDIILPNDWVLLSQNFDTPYIIPMADGDVRPTNGKIAGISAHFSNNYRELMTYRIAYGQPPKPYIEHYSCKGVVVYTPPEALYFRYKAIKDYFLYQAAKDLRNSILLLLSKDLSLSQENFSLWTKSKKVWVMANNPGTVHEGETAMGLAVNLYERLFHNLTHNLYARDSE